MIDILLLVFMAGYAISGLRQGLVIGMLSLGGFVGGAMLAIWLIPSALSQLEAGPRRSFLVLFAVIVVAWTGQFAGALLGGRLRDGMPRGPVAVLDHLAGGLAGVVAVSLVLWFVAGAVRGGPSPQLSRLVAGSKVVQAIDGAVPPQFDEVAEGFRASVGGSTFPRVFEGVGPENIAPIDPPSRAVEALPPIRLARGSIVKITGEASCGRGQEGSGFVVARDRVVTNAHVVAGVSAPRVEVRGGGRPYAATVVSFDHRRDIAVLHVPGFPAPPLRLAADLPRGTTAAVAGFPNNGPYRVDAARVRQVIEATGEDIYGEARTQRQVYSLYATVQPGNSGGPLLSTAGQVVGLVFAKSLDDDRTAYALTMQEARGTILAGIKDDVPVGDTRCANG